MTRPLAIEGPFPHLATLYGPGVVAVTALAALATLVLLLLLFERRLRPFLRRLGLVHSRPLAVNLAIGCTLMTLVPAIWTVLVFAEIHASGLLTRSADRLQRSVAVVARDVGGLLSSHQAALAALADALDQPATSTPKSSGASTRTILPASPCS